MESGFEVTVNPDKFQTILFDKRKIDHTNQRIVVDNQNIKVVSSAELLGIQISSIVKWGYQENLKPVYFFLQKDFERTKTQINQNQPTKTKISKHKNDKDNGFCTHKNF